MNINIKTKRLILRPITEADAKDFFELDSNPNVHKYLGKNPVSSIEQSKAMIKDILEQYKTNNIGRLAIVLKDTSEFVGWSGLKYEQNLQKQFNYYDVGYRLKEKFWGNGYATEAALASLDYGFKDLKLTEISAAAELDHIVSNTILKKIGMLHNGTFTYNDTLLNWYTIKNPEL